MYWLVVILGFVYLGWKENKEGGAAHMSEPESDTSSDSPELVGKHSDSEAVTVGTAEKHMR